MESNQKYMISENVVFARVCDTPVLAATRPQYYESDVVACLLNETGEFIWKQIELGCDQDQIVRHAEDFFEADREWIRHEVIEFLNTLEKQQMIQLCGET